MTLENNETITVHDICGGTVERWDEDSAAAAAAFITGDLHSCQLHCISSDVKERDTNFHTFITNKQTKCCTK